MVNSYCGDLDDTFAQMVYFGVLKEEDAQCFAVTSRIGYNSFVLVAGAILLSFLNSFVCKATAQYVQDEKKSERQVDGKDGFSDRTLERNDEETDDGVVTTISPVPVLFTDTFRWMLSNSSDAITSSSRTLFLDPINSHWSLPEATVVTSDNFHPDNQASKGTYVSELDPTGKVDTAATRGSPSTRRGGINQHNHGSTKLQLNYDCNIKKNTHTDVRLVNVNGQVNKETRLRRLDNRASRVPWIPLELPPMQLMSTSTVIWNFFHSIPMARSSRLK